ncbi:CCA tRNA nucleotidyltransferase [Microvirga tunisiensis]|uniref:CCA tRNA nucleotidyltransferase n=1 Tax=Pannonibacter tanglangensis TaxID=2750084 RepID=A0A7X5EZA9_9HYPH|nr:CCA tRNA nucleotidyltransferase [Pannonibacter sp. XCT-53]NBN76871.1 CCA tRNA nucleotidyltransferase [Pannonibacter sp. XCT-53]
MSSGSPSGPLSAPGSSPVAPSLAGQPWLADPALQQVFEAIGREGDELRAVGGVVRNSLLGVPVSDVDLCSTALPEVVMQRARAAGLKAVPTGIEHGTVTVVSAGQAFEITTLREDVETFGRHAVVRFGRDWARDAARRDFTLNALYCAADGTVHDPLRGLSDCLARRVRFIGAASQRIREDYLRILRFFRMHACYGSGSLDPDGLSAAIALRDGLRQLSAERVGAELKRLVVAPGAAPVLRQMEDCGILEIVTGGLARLALFEALVEAPPEVRTASGPDAPVEGSAQATVTKPAAPGPTAPGPTSPGLAAPVALAALFGFVREDLERLAARLRLSNAERERMLAARSAGEALAAAADPERRLKALVVDAGPEPAADGLRLAIAACRAGGGDPAALVALRPLLEAWPVPVFPVGGRDLVALGLPKGPALGATLARLRQAWVASDYAASRADLLRLVAAELPPAG